jgi:antigen flippase
MKSALKATAVLGSVSAVSIVAGLVSAKVSALLLGPAGVGLIGLLQSLLGLAGLFVGFGVGPGLVQAGARALARDDLHQVKVLRRSAWLVALGSGLLSVAAMAVFALPISRVMLGDAAHMDSVLLVAPAVILNLAAGVQTGLLNAYRRIGDLARVGMLGILIGTPVSLFVLWQWRERGIAPSVLASAVVTWAVSFYYMRVRVPVESGEIEAGELGQGLRSLLGFGVPYTASMLAGAGVLMLVPVLVLHRLGQEPVGFYRAASAISINYLGFLLTAMAQDYYPRVSAVDDQPDALIALIQEQLHLVLLLCGPIILATLALVPFLVPLVYSSRFGPAENLLEWQLIGDLFKFSSWTMAFVIMVRLGTKVFFCIEVFGGSLLLLVSWFAMPAFGLDGLGIGFTAASAAYCLLCLLLLRRHLGLRWSRQNTMLFLMNVGALIAVRALPYLGLVRFRMPFGLTLAFLLGGYSAMLIWQEFGGWKGLRAWLKSRRAVATSAQPFFEET